MLRLMVFGGLIGAGAIAASWAAPEPALADVRAWQRNCATSDLPAAEGEKTYRDFEVDQPPEAKKNNPKPNFPSALDQAPSAEYDSAIRDRVSGEVTMRFVVDGHGCVDLSTVTVLTTTDSAFTREVMRVLPRYRFTPAKKAGEEVRSWTAFKFLFYKAAGARPPV